MEPIRELPPDRIRFASLWGSLSAALISGLLHGLFVMLLGIAAVHQPARPADVRILVRAAGDDIELEELTIEDTIVHSLEVARDEVPTRDLASGNESDAIDIGGAPEVLLTTDREPGRGASPAGFLDTNLRQALLAGLGGPGAGSGQGGAGSSSFRDMVADAHDYGLDVVIAMDTTGSMGGEIETVKRRIVSIGGALLSKVPEARISIVSYKDHGDDYVVKGVSLTSDIADVQRFLAKLKAGGGGDPPEAVEEGLRWAIENNEFRPSARKVILLFGDRPPHEDDHPYCVSLVTAFRNQQNGIVSTITCRQNYPIPHFQELAKLGGGEACILKDSRRIMEELLVLLFGRRHRQDVVEFFELDAVDERPSPATEEALRGLGLLSEDGAEPAVRPKAARKKK